MPEPDPNLPDAEALAERLAETEPHPVPAARRALPLAAIGLALAAALFGPPLIGTLAPWLALGGICFEAVRRGRRARRWTEALTAAEELSRLRRPLDAFRAADALLPAFVHEPGPSAHCVEVMGRSLLLLRRPEAALLTVNTLLDRLPPQHPARPGVLLHRAVAEFECDRLADGDATLGKLRSLLDLRAEPASASAPPAEPAGPDAIERRAGRPFPPPDREAIDRSAAAFRAARLVQSAFTYHVADAVADAEAAGGARASFGALGIDAGFAHGLLAWCHWKLHDAEAAGEAWARATRLVPAGALVHRFPRLAEVAEARPAAGGLPA